MAGVSWLGVSGILLPAREAKPAVGELAGTLRGTLRDVLSVSGEVGGTGDSVASRRGLTFGATVPCGPFERPERRRANFPLCAFRRETGQLQQGIALTRRGL